MRTARPRLLRRPPSPVPGLGRNRKTATRNGTTMAETQYIAAVTTTGKAATG
jgi:hypothetical protein